eukprot:g32657.t1
MNRKGLVGYGPNAGKRDKINLGYLLGTAELDRRICFRAVQLYDSVMTSGKVTHDDEDDSSTEADSQDLAQTALVVQLQHLQVSAVDSP